MTTRLEKEDVKKFHEGTKALVKEVLGEGVNHRFALFVYTDFAQPSEETIQCGTHLIASMELDLVAALMSDWLNRKLAGEL